MRSLSTATYLACLLTLTGCMDVGFTPRDSRNNPDDPLDTDVSPDQQVGDPRPEVCNGVDDDRDGQIDEGYPDTDGDGVADCVDETCEVNTPRGTRVQVRDVCVGQNLDDVEDPWDLVVEWQYRGDPTVSMPAIANLTDDNFDGVVDENDIPDIVFSTYLSGEMVAITGDTGTELWRAPGFRTDTGVALGDIDNDGEVEAVGVTKDNRIRAIGPDGEVEWTSKDSFDMLYPIATIADLNGDGIPEVIADSGVVSGLDGATIAQLDVGRTGPWRAPVVADIDLDGRQEIILGTKVFNHRGELLWETPRKSGAISSFAAIVQADTDREAEVVFAYGDELRFHEHNGDLIRSVKLNGGTRPGPPCVGDLDGDGQAEIAVPSSSAITAYELDGTKMWRQRIDDSSGASGCVVFDMDGDLDWEVIYADMEALMIFDGKTGTLNYRNSSHGSVTYFETPVVADIDLDGSAEIITASSGYSGYSGITVFGHAGDGWPAAGPTWPVHDFALTNTSPDGSVPTHPDPYWLKYNLFRGRPASDTGALPDLVVDLNDLCVASCEEGGLLRMSVRVTNFGEMPVDAGTVVAVELVDGKNIVEYDRFVLPEIPAAMSLDAVTFDMPWSEVPSNGFRLHIDPGQRIYECDEDNNVYRYRDGFCGT